MLKKIYLIVIAIIVAAVAVVFDTFPRSTMSELEKRRLASFPNFTFGRLCSGDFTKEVSLWFSDSEPYRDDIMAFSMKLKEMEGAKSGDDDVSFIAADQEKKVDEAAEAKAAEAKNRNINGYENHLTADADAKIGNDGVVIVGSGKNSRALSAFKGTAEHTKQFSDMVNKYQSTFGKDVQVYCMINPTAIEFYCPDKAKSVANSQADVIKACYARLDSTVKAVDCYTALGKHAKEDIYLRTDHHWTALGGYYAAEQFAKVAKCKFKPLSSYTKHVVHDYVGSMYGFSHSAKVKEAAEDFVYWTPNGVEYSTTYVIYPTKDFKIIGENPPAKGDFFIKYPDGSTQTYLTFMGGDNRIAKVETNTKNGRRLAILKDSYGNTLPAYLFQAFEEIHLIDYRYFLPNLTSYVKENKITDFLVTFYIFNACTPYIAYGCEQLLTQRPKNMGAK